MQTVQRAEFWGAIVAPQAYWPCHLGIDNLNVALSIGCLLDSDCLSKPLPFVKDGDLIALARYMIRTRGPERVRVNKVKGHAEDLDVQQGRVHLLDKKGNAKADVAADLGRRHQSEVLIDARRRLLGARSHWYPIMTDLHRFMVAIARVSVNHDGKGGPAPDPLVRDQGSKPEVRKLAIRVNVDLASLPGPPGFLNSSWVQVNAGHITGSDIAGWWWWWGNWVPMINVGCTRSSISETPLRTLQFKSIDSDDRGKHALPGKLANVHTSPHQRG